jgi:hypothetical protein
MTVIGKAKELIEEVGHEKAIEFFENEIKELGEITSFDLECRLSGLETAIEFIRKDK